MQKSLKTNRLEIRISDRTQIQLSELQRILSGKTGLQITKTQAIEMAINSLLENFASNPNQARLI